MAFVRKFPVLLFAATLFSSCTALRNAGEAGFTEGTYRTALFGGRGTRVYVATETDTINVYSLAFFCAWPNPLGFSYGYPDSSRARHMILPDPVLQDSDTDGIADQFDRCPATVAGIAVDSHGCPMDTDGDGVPDDRDSQLMTPAGLAVDSTGQQKDPLAGDIKPAGLDNKEWMKPHDPPGPVLGGRTPFARWPEMADRIRTTKATYYKPSFDLDVLSIPFKYRPVARGFPRQLNTAFNGALYAGYRIDQYRLYYRRSPLGEYGRRISHYGYSGGLFAGIGATPMNPWVTNYAIDSEYDGLVVATGAAVIVAINTLSFGAGVGIDHLMDRNRAVWIYRNKPWIGFLFGLNLN